MNSAEAMVKLQQLFSGFL